MANATRPSHCPAALNARRHPPPHRPVQPGAPRAAQRRASLRPERAALQPVPRSRPAIFLRLLPARRRDAGRGAGRQEAAYRRQAVPGPAGPDGAGHRLRLGRPGADPGARSRRAGHRHHAVDRAAATRRARGPRPRGWRTASSFELLDYRAVDRHVRPHRLGRHVRACRRRATTASSSTPWRAA